MSPIQICRRLPHLDAAREEKPEMLEIARAPAAVAR